MIEIWHLLWIAPFCLTLGMIFAETFGAWNRKCGEIKQAESRPEEDRYGYEITVERDPMSLRNGYGVTKDKNPTFAEQWVNIMNFSGESQMEGDYEESKGDYSAENME